MKKSSDIFFIFGYGIPKDILIDDNYNFYVKMVFNHIYKIVTEKNIQNPVVICSGGKTDMYPPYRRTEGQEMIRFFKHLTQKPWLKKVTKDWKFVAEKKSLSTVENMIFCKEILDGYKERYTNIHIFSEFSRRNRISKVAKKIFSNKKVIVHSIDFDTSSLRYLEPEFILQKEKRGVKCDMWALKNKEHLKKYHKLFEDKITFLRKAGPDAQQEAIHEWWTKSLEELGIDLDN